MQKKVYTKDLDLGEILRRLENGQRIYNDNNLHYLAKDYNALIDYDENYKPKFYNVSIPMQSTYTYFLDEVEEPEADESCIGKLCWRWDTDFESHISLGILKEIKNKGKIKYLFTSGGRWLHCRPLTKEEALALVKE